MKRDIILRHSIRAVSQGLLVAILLTGMAPSSKMAPQPAKIPPQPVVPSQATWMEPYQREVEPQDVVVQPASTSNVVAATASTTWWAIDPVDTANDFGSHTSVAIDPRDDTPYISYYDATNQDLRLAKYVGSGGNCGPNDAWSCETVYSSGAVGQYSSLAIWDGGSVWKLGISYLADWSLRYAEYREPPGDWTFTFMDSGDSVTYDGVYTSLKFDSTGTPHIAYCHTQYPEGGVLRYARYFGSGGNCGSSGNGNTWQCDTIESGDRVGPHASLDLNASGQPRIAYHHAGDGDLKYAQYLGSGGNCGPGNTWQCDTIEAVTEAGGLLGSGRQVSLHVGQSTTHIAYYNALSDKVKYAFTSTSGNCGPGNTWQCSETDDVGSSPGMGVSLDVDSAGAVIAYHDVDDGGVLKVAQPITRLGLSAGNCGPLSPVPPYNHTWQCDTVDDGIRPLDIHDVGQYPAVALHADELASIAYYDATNGDLLVATQTTAPTASRCGGVFVATADASLFSDVPNQNYGSDPTLRIAAPSTRAALFAFDPGDSIPSGATIQSADLELTLSEQEPTPMPYPLQVHSLTEAWSEATVTWNNQPALGTSFDSKYYSQAYSETMPSVVRVDVTTWANLWATGAIPQASLALHPADAPVTDVRFHSRESQGGQYAPRLVVRCSPASAPVPLDSTLGDQRQLAGLARLRADSIVPPTIRLRGGAIGFAALEVAVPSGAGSDGLSRAQWFTEAYSDALRLNDPESELQLVRRSSDDENIFFRQRHHGIPVLSELGVHLDGARVTGVSGGYVPDITLDPRPRLSAEQAEALALALADPGARVIGDTQLRYVNPGLIGFTDQDTHLAWRVNLSTSTSFFIDANSGALLYEQTHAEDLFELDLETGHHDGPASDSLWGCSYWFWAGSNDQWCDKVGCIKDPEVTDEARNAYFNVRRAWYYYHDIFGRDSYDDAGSEILMYIHVGNNWRNAHWLDDCKFWEYGDGYARARDVVGHEFTHAVIRDTADLKYANEPGALNESFADIFGHFIENPDYDWEIGEDTPDGAMRDMSSPYVDHMNKWVTPSDWPCAGDDIDEKNGCVHTNSGILNKVAYLIEAGDRHNDYDTRPGLSNGDEPCCNGREKAERLFYFTLTERLGKLSKMEDARNGAVSEAEEFVAESKYDFTAGDVCIVRNAFAAVGLGSGDQDCDGVEDEVDTDYDNDGIPDYKDNCPDVPNPGQDNNDAPDDWGDACDDNDDNDVWNDVSDNCPLVPQSDQADWNGNGIGDACEDWDGDGVYDYDDNCRDVPNRDQKNSDAYLGDTLGDACDPDDDHDGVLDDGGGDGINGNQPCTGGATTNCDDNCPLTPNPDQKDADVVLPNGQTWCYDGYGDACDLCGTTCESGPWANVDTDNDGQGNLCDPDDDNDGVLDDGDGDGINGLRRCTGGETTNCDDNCQYVKNPSQQDLNNNGKGTACEDEIPDFDEVVFSHQFMEEEVTLDIPTPGTCPSCGPGYLANGWMEVANVMISTDAYVMVVSSEGEVMDHGHVGHGDLQHHTLTWEAAPQTFIASGGVAGALAPLGGTAPYSDTLAPDGIRYWLQIYPAEGTDLSQVYTVTVQFTGGVPPSETFLPLIMKQ